MPVFCWHAVVPVQVAYRQEPDASQAAGSKLQQIIYVNLYNSHT